MKTITAVTAMMLLDIVASNWTDLVCFDCENPVFYMSPCEMAGQLIGAGRDAVDLAEAEFRKARHDDGLDSNRIGPIFLTYAEAAARIRDSLRRLND